MCTLIILLLSCSAIMAAEQSDLRFVSATQIVFTSVEPKRIVTVSKPAALRPLIAAVRLEPKPNCKCDHSLTARFVTGKQHTDVSFCDHCFDVDGKTFQMPKDFYERAIKIIRPKRGA